MPHRNPQRRDLPPTPSPLTPLPALRRPGVAPRQHAVPGAFTQAGTGWVSMYIHILGWGSLVMAVSAGAFVRSHSRYHRRIYKPESENGDRQVRLDIAYTCNPTHPVSNASPAAYRRSRHASTVKYPESRGSFFCMVSGPCRKYITQTTVE